MPTKALLLNETGKDIAAALWAIAHSQSAELTFDQMAKIIITGSGKKMFPVGTTFYTKKDNYTYPWTFMHHGQHADGRYYAHVRVSKALDLLQYDAAEAFYFAENGLSAGNYTFNIPTTYGQSTAGDYTFTLASNVPAGGKIYINRNIYSTAITGATLQVYNSINDVTVAQTATVNAGNTGTALGSLQIAGDDLSNNINSIQRICYGSNNYAQSAAYMYLTSDQPAGSVWSASNKFDMPPSWHATQPGFLAKLPQGFIDIVTPVTMRTVTNSVFEVGYTISSYYSTTSKFWLPSRYQVFGTTEGTDLSEERWDYYNGATDADRIMYDNNGTARNQWLRTPSVGGAYSVRGVNAAGALSSYNAAISIAVAPACEISAIPRS